MISGNVSNSSSPVMINFELVDKENKGKTIHFSGMLENHSISGKYSTSQPKRLIKKESLLLELSRGIFELELESTAFEGIQI